jgi:hypothetical protein
MKKLAFAILFLLVPFSSSYPADPPTKLALLFAVPQSSCPEDFECGHGQGAFETFLLVIDGDQMKVAVRTPHLYVPRKSGFWEIGILPPKNLGGEQNGGDGSSNWYDWKLWAAPVGKKPELPPFDNGNSDQGGGHRRLTLSWVGNDYLSMTDYYETSSGSLNYVTAPMILSLDDLGNSGFSTFSSLKPWSPDFPPGIYKRELGRCVSDGDPDGFHTREFLESADQGWNVVRGRMRWEYEWTFNHGSGGARGFNSGCATTLRPPRSLVGADTLVLGWNHILPHVPDAQTAFSSPDGSLLLIFTKRQILAFHPAEGVLTKPFATLPIESHPILAAQWAVGKYADNWAQILVQAKSWTE